MATYLFCCWFFFSRVHVYSFPVPIFRIFLRFLTRQMRIIIATIIESSTLLYVFLNFEHNFFCTFFALSGHLHSLKQKEMDRKIGCDIYCAVAAAAIAVWKKKTDNARMLEWLICYVNYIEICELIAQYAHRARIHRQIASEKYIYKCASDPIRKCARNEWECSSHRLNRPNGTGSSVLFLIKRIIALDIYTTIQLSIKCVFCRWNSIIYALFCLVFFSCAVGFSSLSWFST